MQVSKLSIRELKIECQAALEELTNLGFPTTLSSTKSTFKKENWVNEYINLLKKLKQSRILFQKQKELNKKNHLLGNLTQKYESHLHLIFEWICLPEEKKGSLSELLLSKLCGCILLQSVSKLFKAIVEKKIYPLVQKFWIPLDLTYEELQKENKFGYKYWPHLNTLQNQPFQDTIHSFSAFCNLFPNSKAYKTTVCKTIPFQSYHLQYLHQLETQNPHYSKSISTLFERVEVAEACLLVYGNFDTFKKNRRIIKQKGLCFQAKENERTKEKRNRAKVREENKRLREGKKKRKADLLSALSKKGLELREDSRLCKEFIENESRDYSLGEIVTKMVEMRFFFEYTDYERIRDRMKREEILSQRELFGRGFYPVDMDEISESAKSEALARYKGDRSVIPRSLRQGACSHQLKKTKVNCVETEKRNKKRKLSNKELFPELEF